MTCPEFWLDNPMVLITGWRYFFPFLTGIQLCTASALNSFTRFGIYLSIILALLKLNPIWLLISVLFAGLSIGFWYLMKNNDTIRENFLDIESPIVNPEMVDSKYVPDVIGASGRTEPTAANPFMNVLMTEYVDSPLRYPAASSDSGRVGSALDQYFDTMFNRNPGDVFNRSQSQRQFITMPSTSIPNDQEAYMNWLYRTPGQTCKEGNTDACVFDTGPAQFPWREVTTGGNS
jgi:hypothetical protein